MKIPQYAEIFVVSFGCTCRQNNSGAEFNFGILLKVTQPI